MELTLFQNSLLVSASATLLAGLCGVMVALWAFGLSHRWRRVVMGCAVVALCWPHFLVTACWLDLFGLTGTWRAWIPWDIYSLSGTVWLLALVYWPVPMLLTLAAWQHLPPQSLEVDAELRGARLLRHLLLPHARQPLLLALAIVFVLALNNFAIPAILQTKVYPAEVWISFNTTFDYAAALRLSWPLVLAPLLLLAVTRNRSVEWSGFAAPMNATTLRRQLGSGWFQTAGGLSCLLLALSVILPSVQLLSNSRTWSEMTGAIAAGSNAIAWSFFTAALAATLATALGLLLWRSRPANLLWLLFLMPGVLVGIALIYLLNRPPLAAFYQSAGVVLLALVIRYVALARTGMAVAMRSLNRDLIDSARLAGASAAEIFTKVQWPQIAASVAAVWYLIYLLCLWDVESLVLIIPPGAETLSLRIFHLLHYGHNAQVAALCTLLLALALLPLTIWIIFQTTRRQPSSSSSSSSNPRSRRGNEAHYSSPVPPGTPENSPAIHRWVTGLYEQLAPQGRQNVYRRSMEHASANPRLFPSWEGLGVGSWRALRIVLTQRRNRSSLSPQRGEGSRVRGGYSYDMISSQHGASSNPPGLELQDFFRISSFGFRISILLLLTSCQPPHDHNTTPLPGDLFSGVQIIGSRGTGAGQFNKPRSLAVDLDDNLYVVDMTGRVQKFSPAGQFLAFWQMPQTDLGRPKGMCLDELGNIVVIEPHYSRINHFSPDGKLATQWGRHGTNAGFVAFPRAAVVNTRGEIYVSEYGKTERIQRFTSQGAAFLTEFGRAGQGDGEFSRPEGLGIDAVGQIYVADSCNHRIQIFSPDGHFLRAYGRAGRDRGELSYPYDVRIDEAGRQFVCEFGNSRIQIFDAEGKPLEIIGGPGTAPGEFANPWSIAFDSHGNLYVADSANHRVQKLLRRHPVQHASIATASPAKGGVAK
ncbi:MAG: ABC transporter permease subunit [Verrucomicrobiota bacterium]